MPNTAAPWNLTYPALADVPNAPTAIQNLANSVQGTLGRAYPCTSTTRPGHVAGLMIFETDTGLHQISDGATWWPIMLDPGVTGTTTIDVVTAGFSAAANMSIVSGTLHKWGPVVSMYVSVNTTNAIGSGDNANIALFTVPSAYIPSSTVGGFVGGANGGAHNSFLSSGTGVMTMSANVGGFTAGQSFNVTGTYLL